MTNDQVVNNILVKALTTLPEPDFNLCLYLLNEQMVAEEPVVRLIALQDLIEQARYADFWKLYEGDDIYKELTAEVLGFEDSIRASTFCSRGLFSFYLHDTFQTRTCLFFGCFGRASWFLNYYACWKVHFISSY